MLLDMIASNPYKVFSVQTMLWNHSKKQSPNTNQIQLSSKYKNRRPKSDGLKKATKVKSKYSEETVQWIEKEEEEEETNLLYKICDSFVMEFVPKKISF